MPFSRRLQARLDLQFAAHFVATRGGVAIVYRHAEERRSAVT